MKRARKRVGDPKKAIAYIRVSTNRDRQELGADAQKAAIEKWAAAEGVTIAEWFEEEVSGGAPIDKRPRLLDAIVALSKHGAGILVVQKMDRFARDTTVSALLGADIAKAGARLVSTAGEGNGDDPASKMMRTILMAVAEYEKAIIGARIRAALAVKKARNEMTGKAPFGMRVGADGKTLEPCPQEQAVIRRVRKLRAEGYTVRGVVYELERLGVVGRAGRPLSLKTVHSLAVKAA